MYFACLIVSGPFEAGLRADGNLIPGGIAGVAATEAQKRQERVTAAQTLFTAGSKAYSDRSYAEAMDYFKAAFETIPDVPAVADQRLIFFKRYQTAAYQYAVVLAEEAKWAESEQTLADVVALADSAKMEKAIVEPGVRKMLEDLRNFDDRYNMAATPQHLRAVNTVQSKLILGKGYLELGDYDRAERAFNEALAVDPFNTAARRGLEDVEGHRRNYYDAATDHTRSRALAEVMAGWESPVRVPMTDSNRPINMDGIAEGGGASIEKKLKEILIPRVEFENARLLDVVEFLSQTAQELDNSETDPRKRGVNIVIDSSGLAGGEDAGQRILSVKMSNIPLGVALKYAAQQVGMVYRTDNFAVRVISEFADDGGTLVSRRYVVPPGFISAGAESTAASGPVDPFSTAVPGAGAGALVERISPQQFLESRGVVFGPGASASFIAATNSLVVRNTSQQLETIGNIVQAARDNVPKNVEVHVKIVSIEAETLKVLGMDFLLGQSSLFNNAVFSSGGTNGNAADALDQADYPFAGVGGPIGLNPITSGLRMGTLGTNQSIQDVLQQNLPGAATTRAPGVFSVAGVLTNPQFQLVIRALSQAKGSDLLSDANVTVKPGQLAKIEVVREFIYPTEYDPPEVPNIGSPGDDTDTDVDDGGGPIIPGNDLIVIPVTPANPTAFETRRLGHVLEVEPTVAADNKTVSVNILLDVSEFIGFINYGSPVRARGEPITDNEILMPVFDAIKETTNVTIWDGQTIAIGGFHGESRTDTQDKIPGLGDLPAVGRGFRSMTGKSAKRAMTIFLTVKLIDPGGNLINLPADETTEFTVPPRFNPSGGLQSGSPLALPYPAK